MLEQEPERGHIYAGLGAAKTALTIPMFFAPDTPQWMP